MLLFKLTYFVNLEYLRQEVLDEEVQVSVILEILADQRQ